MSADPAISGTQAGTRLVSRSDPEVAGWHIIEHYFRWREHLTVDGKPVVILFSVDRLREDHGSDGVSRAFASMREEGRRAGLQGLHLIACVADGARYATDRRWEETASRPLPENLPSGGTVHAQVIRSSELSMVLRRSGC